MARNAVSTGWRLAALIALTAGGLALVCASAAEAQRAGKAAAKQAKSDDQNKDDGDAAKTKKKKQDPVEAQRAIEAAAKLLEHGKAEPAAQSLTTVVAGGNLPPAIMAKALLYRGMAYRQQKKPAQAIADLTSALWLKGGLAANERTEALNQRTAAYQEAGLSETGEVLATAASAPATARARSRAVSSEPGSTEGWSASTSTAAPKASLAEDGQNQPASGSQWTFGSGFSNPFAGLFGGSASAPSTPAKASAPLSTAAVFDGATTMRPDRRPTRPATSGWSSATEVSTAAAPAAVHTSALSKPEGKFRIQLGMVRAQSDAQALAAKVMRQHATDLSQRQPEIDQTVVGNMGTFYRVRIGPFASQNDGQAACAKIKGSGVDCMVVAQ